MSTAMHVVATGAGAVPVMVNLSGLLPGTRYQFRVVAEDTATGALTSGTWKSFVTAAPKQVASTMRYGFQRHDRYVAVTRLVALGVPAGATVTVTCTGKGCPFATRADRIAVPTSSLHLREPFLRARLSYGTTLSVAITRPDYVGKVFTFDMSRSRVSRTAACLAPGSSRPQSC